MAAPRWRPRGPRRRHGAVAAAEVPLAGRRRGPAPGPCGRRGRHGAAWGGAGGAGRAERCCHTDRRGATAGSAGPEVPPPWRLSPPPLRRLPRAHTACVDTSPRAHRPASLLAARPRARTRALPPAGFESVVHAPPATSLGARVRAWPRLRTRRWTGATLVAGCRISPSGLQGACAELPAPEQTGLAHAQSGVPQAEAGSGFETGPGGTERGGSAAAPPGTVGQRGLCGAEPAPSGLHRPAWQCPLGTQTLGVLVVLAPCWDFGENN